MSTPAPNNPNEPTSRMKKILSSSVDESIKSRLPRDNGATVASAAVSQPVSAPASPPAAPAPARKRLQLMPAFWTIASLMSISVNIVMLAVILILLQMLGDVQRTADDQVSGLLGGLYQNFVKMDQATISTTIPVKADIPLNLTIPVDLSQTATQITLAQDARIENAMVRINQGGVAINAPALVTLPAETVLMVRIAPFSINVTNQTVPIDLNVAVNIPLNQTQLHEPFVGLQNVVEPWYCMIEPNAIMNGVQVCAPGVNP